MSTLRAARLSALVALATLAAGAPLLAQAPAGTPPPVPAATAQPGRPPAPDTAKFREAMKPFLPAVGKWRGEGWMQMGPGEPQRTVSEERVESRLEGLVLVIEGLHHARNADGSAGRVVHNALGHDLGGSGRRPSPRDLPRRRSRRRGARRLGERQVRLESAGPSRAADPLRRRLDRGRPLERDRRDVDRRRHLDEVSRVQPRTRRAVVGSRGGDRGQFASSSTQPGVWAGWTNPRRPERARSPAAAPRCHGVK